MSDWGIAAWLMLGGSTVLLFIGMPVALTFITVNIVGAWLYMGGEPGLVQLARSSVSSIAAFSLTPIPLFVLMGEVLFHTGLALKVIEGIERLIRRVPGRLAVVAVVAGTVFSAISGSTIATTAMLGSLMLPVMLARGYHPVLATGPDHGHRRRGHADSAVGADGAARLAVGHLDLQAAGRRRPARRAAVDCLRDLDRHQRAHQPQAGARRTTSARATAGFSRWQPFFAYVLPTLSIFGIVVGALADGWATPTECAALGAFATMVLAALYRALTPRGAAQGAAGHGRRLRDDPVHHPGRHRVRPDPVVLRRQQRAGPGDHRPGPVDRRWWSPA